MTRVVERRQEAIELGEMATRAVGAFARGDVATGLRDMRLARQVALAAGEPARCVAELSAAIDVCDHEQARAELALARAQAATGGELPEAPALWAEVHADSLAAGDAEAAARAAFFAFWPSHDASTGSLLRQSAGTDSAWARRCAALVATMAGDFATSAALDLDAYDAALSSGDVELQVLALRGRASALGYLGDPATGCELAREAATLARAAGYHLWSVYARLTLVELLTENLRAHQAVAECAELVEYVRQHRLDQWTRFCTAYQAEACCRAGDLAAALSLAEQAAPQVDAVDGAAGAMAIGIRAQAMLRAGALGPSLDRALQAYAAAIDRSGVAAWGDWASLVRLELAILDGDATSVEELAGRLLDAHAVARAEAALLLVRHAHGSEADGQLQDVSRRCGQQLALSISVADGPHCALALDEVRAYARRDAGALEAVVMMWSRAGRRLDAARARAALAHVHGLAGRTAEREAALATARAELEACGAMGDVSRLAPGVTPASDSLVRGLDDIAVEDVRRHLVSRRIRAGASLALAGEPLEQLIIVRSGALRVVHTSQDGRQIAVGAAEAGDVVGHDSLSEGCWAADVEAVRDTTVECLPLPRLYELCERHPRLALNLLHSASRQVSSARRLSASVAFDPVERRVAAQLLQLVERHGRPTLAGSMLIDTTVTQEQLGEMVAASRKAVSEALRSLREQKVVASRGRQLVVVDADALHALAAAS